MAKEKEVQDGLKLIRAEIKNFKNISLREIELNGRSMIVAGKNNIGKSSLIQALTSPINAKFMPIEPIKKGEERGSIVLTVGGSLHGEEVTYKVGCYFSPEHSRGRIVLENEEGHKITTAKSTLTDILGDISFDIFEFVRMARTDTGKHSDAGVKKQIELLKSLMPREVLVKLHDLDTEYSTVFSERTEINSQIKYLDGQIKNNSFTLEEIEKYAEPLKAEDVSAKIEAARKSNEIFTKANQYVYDFSYKQAEIDERFTMMLTDASIKDEGGTMLKRLMELLEEQKAKCENYIAKNPLIDLNVLNEEMNNISDHNMKVEKIKSLKAEEVKLKEKQKEADKMTERLVQIQEEKKKVFASAPLPVKGLEFNEEAVLYNGLPLNEDQIPTSVLIGIGLKIGMALNPNLRLLVIRDGSLLDKSTTDFILKICEENNYQLLIEIVKPEGNELEIEFIEK